jgi:hypothetical protein
MSLASSSLTVATRQRNSHVQYWTFFSQDAWRFWDFLERSREERQTHPMDYVKYRLPTVAGTGTVLRPSITGTEVPNLLEPLRGRAQPQPREGDEARGGLKRQPRPAGRRS